MNIQNKDWIAAGTLQKDLDGLAQLPGSAGAATLCAQTRSPRNLIDEKKRDLENRMAQLARQGDYTGAGVLQTELEQLHNRARDAVSATSALQPIRVRVAPGARRCQALTLRRNLPSSPIRMSSHARTSQYIASTNVQLPMAGGRCAEGKKSFSPFVVTIDLVLTYNATKETDEKLPTVNTSADGHCQLRR